MTPLTLTGFAVTGHMDGLKNSRLLVSEVLPDGPAFSGGLRPGDEILVLNGRLVSHLDLALTQTLFAEPTLHLSVRRDGAPPPPPPHLSLQLEVRSRHQRAKSSSGAFYLFYLSYLVTVKISVFCAAAVRDRW